MIEEYDIYMGKQVVGNAAVEKQGLYYRFDCRCRLSGAVLCRIVAQRGGHHENLGIPVPRGKDFCLSTRLPMKRFPEGVFSFRVLPKHPSGKGVFVEVYPDEPFAYLSRLKHAFLDVQRGQVGVVIPDSESDPQGSDRSP